ncbi:aminodeoxychorismate lyase [Pseudidiomarina andamanensis]|uniref:Aminodeoxychorismate lyase n=1 Tax=Pseudidiomarina andamanensis TaxID=1940690 RepID=A0AA92ER78_9GAMM|nr:aminodeoxychorismate lyase [Pseudidiomarina andamanensis]MDS0218267.1 aminodeoxychorismate lyase [Pseudidiomarina andamanensis]QGT95153.1 aminodeoxychorismate lyase [Pseudidiomarina andamanensis]
MWHNGQFISQSSLDRGLQFGDGHFTTLVIRHGQPEFWPRHWQRLAEASQRLAMALPPRFEIEQLLTTIAQQQPDCVVKIVITRGYSERGYAPQTAASVNWYVTTAPLSPWQQRALHVERAELQLAIQPRLAGLKTLNRLEQVLVAQERIERCVDDLIVCDSNLHIVEAISSNLFWYDGDNWRIPQLKNAGIAGIMQAEICAAVLPEARPTLAVWDDLVSAEQAFVCNTVLGPRPIGQVGARPLPQQVLPEVVNTWYLNVLSKSSSA